MGSIPESLRNGSPGRQGRSSERTTHVRAIYRPDRYGGAVEPRVVTLAESSTVRTGESGA